MAVVTMKQLLESGVHFGHQARRWNPKMRRFIFMERNGIHIIDLQQTLTRIEDAYAFVKDLASSGGNVLFVGTKKQAQESISEEAKRAGMPYINQRWLGGFLTNFVTIRKRIDRLNELTERKERGDFAAHREHIAVDEARRLEVPVIAMVDTNCDPDLIDVIIPANDDAIRAVKLICQKVADAIIEGRAEFDAGRKETATPEEMGYAPVPAGELEVGMPRARRTPRVYEPEEEEEYPIGGFPEEEAAAEGAEAAPQTEAAAATDEAIAAPAAEAVGAMPASEPAPAAAPAARPKEPAPRKTTKRTEP